MRDEAEKKELKADLERYGTRAKGLLVLTVHECKGLEFQVRIIAGTRAKGLLLLTVHECKGLSSKCACLPQSEEKGQCNSCFLLIQGGNYNYYAIKVLRNYSPII